MNEWENFSKLILSTKYNDERDFEAHFAQYLHDCFEWDQSLIKTQYRVSVGHESKRADIIIESGKERFLIFELKAHGVNLSTPEFVQQLISYMGCLRLEFGVMANPEEINLYYYPLSHSAQPTKVFSLAFNSDSSVGNQFASILNKDNFSIEKLRSFCEKRIKDIEKVGELVDRLASERGKDDVKESLLLNQNLVQQFGKDIIESAMETIALVARGKEKIIDKNQFVFGPNIQNNPKTSSSYPKYLTEGIGGIKFAAECLAKYSEMHYGEIITSKQIIEDVHEQFGCRRDEILPADYAINPSPDRTAPMMEPRLFERVDRGQYKCLGAVSLD